MVQAKRRPALGAAFQAAARLIPHSISSSVGPSGQDGGAAEPRRRPGAARGRAGTAARSGAGGRGAAGRGSAGRHQVRARDRRRRQRRRSGSLVPSPPFRAAGARRKTRLTYMQNPPLLLPQEPGQGAVRLPALPPPRAFHHAMLVSGRERRSTPGRMGGGFSPRAAQPCSTRSPRHAVSGSPAICSSAARPAGCC